MNAYLFSAAIVGQRTRPDPSHPNQPQRWDFCTDSIVGGETAQQAQERYEAWLHHTRDDSTELEIKQIIATPFTDQLLSELGPATLDWPTLCRQAVALLENTAAEESQQGYWVDVNNIPWPSPMPESADALLKELPPEVRDGLNWEPDKLFLFIISALVPIAAPTQDEPGTPFYDESSHDLPAADVPMPELLEKECAAVVCARNSVVATWLWKRFAAATAYDKNEILIIPWCGTVGLDPTTEHEPRDQP